jgi:hypothetical protein
MLSGSGHALLSEETLPLSTLSQDAMGPLSQEAPREADYPASIVWRTGFRGVSARSTRITERLTRPIDHDQFARLARERDVLDAFVQGEAGVDQLTRKLRLLGEGEKKRYRELLVVPTALFAAVAERQLGLLPVREAPRPREKVLRDEIEAACWTTYREGAASVTERLEELSHQRSGDVEEQIRYGLERAALSALFAGSKGMASALKRRRAAEKEAEPEQRHVARLAVQVMEPMLRVLLLAEGA